MPLHLRALLAVPWHRMSCVGALPAPGEFLRRNGSLGAGLLTGTDGAAPVRAVRSRGERRRETRHGAAPLPAVPPAPCRPCVGLGRCRVPLGPVPRFCPVRVCLDIQGCWRNPNCGTEATADAFPPESCGSGSISGLWLQTQRCARCCQTGAVEEWFVRLQ